MGLRWLDVDMNGLVSGRKGCEGNLGELAVDGRSVGGPGETGRSRVFLPCGLATSSAAKAVSRFEKSGGWNMVGGS